MRMLQSPAVVAAIFATLGQALVAPPKVADLAVEGRQPRLPRHVARDQHEPTFVPAVPSRGATTFLTSPCPPSQTSLDDGSVKPIVRFDHATDHDSGEETTVATTMDPTTVTNTIVITMTATESSGEGGDPGDNPPGTPPPGDDRPPRTVTVTDPTTVIVTKTPGGDSPPDSPPKSTTELASSTPKQKPPTSPTCPFADPSETPDDGEDDDNQPKDGSDLNPPQQKTAVSVTWREDPQSKRELCYPERVDLPIDNPKNDGARVDDCRKLMGRLGKAKGYYSTKDWESDKDWALLVENGSCGVYLQRNDNNLGHVVEVGAKDVESWLKAAIDKCRAAPDKSEAKVIAAYDATCFWTKKVEVRIAIGPSPPK